VSEPSNRSGSQSLTLFGRFDLTILSMAFARNLPSVWSAAGIGCIPGCASKSVGNCSDSGCADDIGAGVDC